MYYYMLLFAQLRAIDLVCGVPLYEHSEFSRNVIFQNMMPLIVQLAEIELPL